MILLVHSYPGANDTVERHYPFWEKCGFDRIIGIGTHGGGCTWPDGMESCLIGRDTYIDGDALPRRLIDTVHFALTMSDWNEAAIIEYDTVTLRPFPIPLPNGFSAHLAGGQPPGMKCHQFFHNPWIAPRNIWSTVLVAGREMLQQGDIEQGSPDCFIGWLAEKYSIPVFVDAFRSYSQNTIHTPEWIAEARRARLDGVHAIHGIKDAQVLKEIMA